MVLKGDYWSEEKSPNCFPWFFDWSNCVRSFQIAHPSRRLQLGMQFHRWRTGFFIAHHDHRFDRNGLLLV